MGYDVDMENNYSFTNTALDEIIALLGEQLANLTFDQLSELGALHVELERISNLAHALFLAVQLRFNTGSELFELADRLDTILRIFKEIRVIGEWLGDILSRINQIATFWSEHPELEAEIERVAQRVDLITTLYSAIRIEPAQEQKPDEWSTEPEEGFFGPGGSEKEKE